MGLTWVDLENQSTGLYHECGLEYKVHGGLIRATPRYPPIRPLPHNARLETSFGGVGCHIGLGWDDQDTKIAQLELLKVLGLISFPHVFRYTSRVWYTDNIAALMALVRRRSDSQELDHKAQAIHILLFHLRWYLWCEWLVSIFFSMITI